ncbi:unnamed protein product [Chondrus crispus]|uniref:Uncharacterized protein n=1 Tax=Chondrus crispus TaxID=2769 RepID=R7Q4R7_CHOCR|nr:unnamed protein product [Chondrus crispus]CDF32450.1 unnamed protein product [Chondrus crispus]|eukprot:XP_005712115.1 unnamed protein product [Chondrus crispus]
MRLDLEKGVFTMAPFAISTSLMGRSNGTQGGGMQRWWHAKKCNFHLERNPFLAGSAPGFKHRMLLTGLIWSV